MLNRIQADALTARKAHDTDVAVFLTTLYAEAARVGKDAGNRDTTEAEVIAVIKKFLKNNEDTIALCRAEAPAIAKLRLENDLLHGYLPVQATDEEIAAAVTELVAALPEKTAKQIGVVMGLLQKRFDGNFDKGVASALVRKALVG